MYKLIHPMNVEEYWSKAAPWIAQAIGNESSWTDLNIIKSKLLVGNSQLWIGYKPGTEEIDVVAVTEGLNIVGKPTLVIRWLSGIGMKNWIQDIGLIEHWAKEQGFAELQIWGRHGFEAVLKPLGYKHIFTVLGLDLNRGMH